MGETLAEPDARGMRRMASFSPASVTFIERRNVGLRNKRDAAAEWLGVHPSELAALDSATVDAIVARLDEEARLARRRTHSVKLVNLQRSAPRR